MSGSEHTAVVWQPQPGPQKALIDCSLSEVFYGGARGGGKTDGILGKWAIKAGKYGQHFNAVFFRREMPQQDDLVERSKDIFFKLGAAWQDQKKTWTFSNGARIRFRPLESIRDAEKYQGQNLTDACVEEAGNYPGSEPIDRLFGCLRSAYGVPTQLILTANPGGPGHQWIKRRYIDPAPQGMQILNRDLPNGDVHKYVFIPAKVADNKILLQNDPSYTNKLYLVGSEELVKAWLDGDWNVITGAYFSEFGNRHILEPFEIPKSWHRFRSFDWGSARPFSVGWWAVVEDDYPTNNGVLPRGALVRYMEWYGASEPNTGLKLTAEEVRAGIQQREIGQKVKLGVADPAIFAEDGGPSIAQRLLPVHFKKADNRRIARQGAMGGWDQMRARLKGDGERPMIYCFSTCVDSIRTIPALQHDLSKPEDVDTDSEDHAADEWRYACMSRPYVPPGVAANDDKTKDGWDETFDDDTADDWKVA